MKIISLIQLLNILEAIAMDYENFLAFVKARRSIRKFKSDPIPDTYVDKIIEAARFAPSAGNSQPWEFIVIKEQETKDRIAEFIKENLAVMQNVELAREAELRFLWKEDPSDDPGFRLAPVLILLCADRRISDTGSLFTRMTRGDSHFVSNLANAFLYMSLAATSLGLASQNVSATGSLVVKPFVRALLGIPEELEIYHMLATGYPAIEPKPRYVRERAEMVHYGIYNQNIHKTDEEVRNYILQDRARRRKT
jgi:5,6-dimethylbenzimidazole synthase